MPGVVRERRVRLPRRCVYVGQAAGPTEDAEQAARAFNAAWDTRLRLLSHDCCSHSQALVRRLTASDTFALQPLLLAARRRPAPSPRTRAGCAPTSPPAVRPRVVNSAAQAWLPAKQQATGRKRACWQRLPAKRPPCSPAHWQQTQGARHLTGGAVQHWSPHSPCVWGGTARRVLTSGVCEGALGGMRAARHFACAQHAAMQHMSHTAIV